jgi:hypothetical protein
MRRRKSVKVGVRKVFLIEEAGDRCGTDVASVLRK